MFIELTQVYRASQQTLGGRLFVNPNHIISMQTGLVCNNVPTTALAVTLDGYLYVAETPEQIMALLDAEPPPNTEIQLSKSDVRELEYSRMDRGSMHYFINEHFPDKTADLTSVLHLFGWIDYQTYKADFKIGSTLGGSGSVKPREWYVETQFGGTTVRIWPYGHYVGCRIDGVYHIADVMPSNDLGDGFIIHFLSDGTIKAARTYEGGH